MFLTLPTPHSASCSVQVRYLCQKENIIPAVQVALPPRVQVSYKFKPTAEGEKPPPKVAAGDKFKVCNYQTLLTSCFAHNN